MKEYEITAQVVFTVWAEDEDAARTEARIEMSQCSFVDIEDIDLLSEDDDG